MVNRAPSDDVRCIADNSRGRRCQGEVQPGRDVCVTHDPDNPRGGYAPPPEERRCRATASGGANRPERKGERCDRWTQPGMSVCYAHGGAAPQVVEAARIRVAEEELMNKASVLLGRPVENPLTELAALAGRARALMEELEKRVQVLLDANRGIGPAGEDEQAEAGQGIRYSHRAGEQIRGEVQLYERAMDRLGRLLVDIARLDIDERLARISEKQVDVVIAAFESGLNAIGVRDPAQRAAAKQAAGRALEAVRAA